VEAVVGKRDRAADRAAGVVDEHVDHGMVGEHEAAEVVDRVGIGQIRHVPVRRASKILDLLLCLLELLLTASHQDRDAAGPGDLECHRPADAARGARDQHRLAVNRALEAAVLEQVGIEVALPVVPERGGVAGELGDRDPGALERALRIAGVELGGQGDVAEDLVGDPEVREDRPANAARGGSAISIDSVPFGSACSSRESIRIVSCGACAADANAFRTSPERWRLGFAEVKCLPVEVGQVGDVVHRGGDVVDRDDVGVAELRPDQRKPAGQVVPGHLDRGEEVIGAVDLVHLAGPRVAHDDRRPVHAPGHPRLRARIFSASNLVRW
jgi:hypothetical protein